MSSEVLVSLLVSVVLGNVVKAVGGANVMSVLRFLYSFCWHSRGGRSGLSACVERVVWSGLVCPVLFCSFSPCGLPDAPLPRIALPPPSLLMPVHHPSC
jgi:hypothetical protein